MSKAKAWIEALQQLVNNPGAVVKCPECQDGLLKIRDVPWPNGNKFDRYLICDKCGSYNAATVTKSK